MNIILFGTKKNQIHFNRAYQVVHPLFSHVVLLFDSTKIYIFRTKEKAIFFFVKKLTLYFSNWIFF
jgi:hypothetical protein